MRPSCLSRDFPTAFSRWYQLMRSSLITCEHIWKGNGPLKQICNPREGPISFLPNNQTTFKRLIMMDPGEINHDINAQLQVYVYFFLQVNKKKLHISFKGVVKNFSFVPYNIWKDQYINLQQGVFHNTIGMSYNVLSSFRHITHFFILLVLECKLYSRQGTPITSIKT